MEPRKQTLAGLKEMAERDRLSYSALMRQAIGTLQAMRDANRDGLYVGATRDRSALEVLIVSP